MQVHGRGSLIRVACFASLWWMLTAGDPRSWIIGVPAVLAATAASMALSPRVPWRIDALALASFIPYFTWRSMAGSVDVAWRALHPRLPISPTLEQYPLRLPPHGPARVFFADVVSLLPGTLSASLNHESMTIHILNPDPDDAFFDLTRLEAKVGALFGCPMTTPGEPGSAP